MVGDVVVSWLSTCRLHGCRDVVAILGWICVGYVVGYVVVTWLEMWWLHGVVMWWLLGWRCGGYLSGDMVATWL